MSDDDPLPVLDYATPPDSHKLNERMSDRLATLALVAFYVALFWPMIAAGILSPVLDLRYHHVEAVIAVGSLGAFSLFILLMAVSHFLHRPSKPR